jgi:hypothetical protein
MQSSFSSKLNALQKAKRIPSRSSVNTGYHHVKDNNARHKTAMLEKMIDAALQELNVVYEFDTTSNLLAQYEVFEDLAFAARRHRAQQTNHGGYEGLDLFCLDNPGSIECRVYDI